MIIFPTDTNLPNDETSRKTLYNNSPKIPVLNTTDIIGCVGRPQ